MDTNGHNETNLTEHPADDIRPTWSPTGERILFVSNRGGRHDLYFMDPDGSDIQRVFEEKSHRVAPIWSPDGKTDCLRTQRTSTDAKYRYKRWKRCLRC